MIETDKITETRRLAFVAKEKQYQDDPHFRLSSAGPLIWLHCVPGWYEIDAFYARDMLPAEVVSTVTACQPHSRHMISVLAGPALPSGMVKEYARLGYKPLPEPPQPLMRRSLSPDTPATAAHEIVCTEISESTRRYTLMKSEIAVSTAEAVWVDPETIYVCGMQTRPEHQRSGLATALLASIHREAVGKGAITSILWSSASGLPLYTRLGYETIATGHSFIPDVII